MLKHIYIVDDSIDFLEVFSSLLRRHKYHPQLIDSRSLLFECLHTRTPDLILMDVKFGYNDGRVLCRELKTKYGLSHTPIILISGDHQSLSDYHKYHADGFLEKPFSLETFLDKAHALVNVVA